MPSTVYMTQLYTFTWVRVLELCISKSDCPYTLKLRFPCCCGSHRADTGRADPACWPQIV